LFFFRNSNICSTGKIDRYRAQFAGLFQPLGNAIYYVDLRSALEQRTISGEQAHGARSEHGHAFSCHHTREFSGVESSGEDIGQEQKIIFPLIARLSWQFQAIEVGVRDQDEFSLSALILPHSRISVSASIHHRENGYFLVAAGRKTKISINGAKMAEAQRELKAGDAIEVAGITAIFDYLT
jgi:hypothetical protein